MGPTETSICACEHPRATTHAVFEEFGSVSPYP
jgi:hypothetical protein